VGVLIELGLVKKETPITETTTRKSVYMIEDNFFRFWYRFVPQNMSSISSGRFEHSFNRVVKARMHDYMGLIFEKMCKEYLMYYAENLPFELAEVGQWWGNDSSAKKEIQIDLVGVPVQEPNQKVTEYLIGSCKFKNEKIGMDELRLLEHYAGVFGKGKSYYFVIFSLGGFAPELIKYAKNNKVKLITLADMYGA
jgi:AAA+ ATPase superfamily predicted ATPase